jgi:hypothetical protein
MAGVGRRPSDEGGSRHIADGSILGRNRVPKRVPNSANLRSFRTCSVVGNGLGKPKRWVLEQLSNRRPRVRFPPGALRETRLDRRVSAFLGIVQAADKGRVVTEVVTRCPFDPRKSRLSARAANPVADAVEGPDLLSAPSPRRV